MVGVEEAEAPEAGDVIWQQHHMLSKEIMMVMDEEKTMDKEESEAKIQEDVLLLVEVGGVLEQVLVGGVH